ncbi:hypothetical protein WS64_30025 [Burkholderia anthina]|uniref:Uncharacterized protein n=1 Tax=Burkholderia anthina TaxID=179879 RepID=A0AAW3PNN1_9BURK|nr:hypothetical protein WS64_30025 [Burkholderia anthina]
MHMNFSIRMFVFGHSTTGKPYVPVSRSEPVDNSTSGDAVAWQNAIASGSSRPEPAWTTIVRASVCRASLRRASVRALSGHGITRQAAGSSVCEPSNSLASLPVPMTSTCMGLTVEIGEASRRWYMPSGRRAWLSCRAPRLADIAHYARLSVGALVGPGMGCRGA